MLHHGVTAPLLSVGIAEPEITPAARREEAPLLLMLQTTKRHLLQMVGALYLPGRFAGRLYGGQQQRHQDADDGDHDQQLDERKGGA